MTNDPAGMVTSTCGRAEPRRFAANCAVTTDAATQMWPTNQKPPVTSWAGDHCKIGFRRDMMTCAYAVNGRSRRPVSSTVAFPPVTWPGL